MKITAILTKLIASFSVVMVLAIGSVTISAKPALAACSSTLTLSSGIDCATPSGTSQKGLFGTDPAHPGNLFKQITNTLIFVIGAVSILMIIIGGLRYVLSAGNSSATAGAKDTILYAVIGVVVAIIAFGIVNFVLTRIQ